MSESKRIAQSASIVGGATLISRILGLVRDILIFKYFDKTATDAFVVAFRLPNLMRMLFGEGALSVSFIPVFTHYLKNKTGKETKELVSVCFTYLSIVVALVTMIGIFFAPEIVRVLAYGPGFANVPEKYALSTDLLRVMFPYLFFVSLVALAMGILNSVGHFFSPAFAPVLLNVGIITGVCIFRHFFERPVLGVAWGVFLGGIVQLAIQIPWVIKNGFLPTFKFNWKHPGLLKISKLMMPALIGLSSVQLSVLIVQEFASFLEYEGAVSYLFLADRLIQFPLGVFAIALGTVLLPAFSSHMESGNHERFQKNLLMGIRMVTFITIPSAVGLIVLSVPLIRVFFEGGEFNADATLATASALAFYSVGLWSASMIRVIVPAYYAFQNTFFPALMTLISLAINTLCCFILIKPLQHGGLALSTSISSIIQVFILVFYFRKKYIKFSWKDFFGPQIKTAIAAGVMGLVLWGFKDYFHWNATGDTLSNIAILTLFIAGSIFVYIGVSFVLKVQEFSYFLRLLKKDKKSNIVSE